MILWKNSSMNWRRCGRGGSQRVGASNRNRHGGEAAGMGGSVSPVGDGDGRDGRLCDCERSGAWRSDERLPSAELNVSPGWS